MPAKPAYCRNLPQGIQLLKNLQTDWVGRLQLSEALGISKTVSWRLMRQCGAVMGPGATLICRREDLIREVRRAPRAALDFDFELELDKLLDALGADRDTRLPRSRLFGNKHLHHRFEPPRCKKGREMIAARSGVVLNEPALHACGERSDATDRILP